MVHRSTGLNVDQERAPKIYNQLLFHHYERRRRREQYYADEHFRVDGYIT
jgi:hypothetical protein